MLHTINLYQVTFTNNTGTHTINYRNEKMARSFVEYYPDASLTETTTEVKITDQMKKEYQRLFKEIREKDFGVDSKRHDNCKFPKPMMTEAQMEKGTATVNCGGEWLTVDTTKRIADKVMANESFKAFLTKYEAKAELELTPFHSYQIRIRF